MMLELSTLVMLVLGLAQSSIVVDGLSQQGVYISDYCPKMEHCAEGAHVICMYYDPNRIMGSRCNNPKNMSVTPDMAEKLLDINNAIRSKIALGNEKGKGGVALPRGFGMFRLKWDSELATFAQVLANQCMLRHDMCRASKKFSDPGQTAGLVRFSYPEWYPKSKSVGLNYPGLTESKIMYAITQALKSWYGQKQSVTAGMIQEYPDWTQNPESQSGRLYLEMIYGPATHMGCGISAYTEYAYYDNNAALNYNSVQIICNYSRRSQKGGTVYEINPPTIVGYTVKCGCPVGYDEDADCLCNESVKEANLNDETCTSKDHNCKPTVVLLPIFTVENAPPEKLAARTGFNYDKKEMEMEILDLYASNNTKHPLATLQQEPISVISNLINEVRPKVSHSESSSLKPYVVIEKNGLFNKIPPQLGRKATGKNLYHGRVQTKKESIFSKAPTFKIQRNGVQIAKTNVLPRKDFSKVKILVKDYLKRRQNDPEEYFKHRGDYLKHFSSAEEKVINFNSHSNTKFSNFFTDFDESKNNSHDKVMNLLDRLEQEVKHFELDESNKEIFDAKIRKIYGTVVGKAETFPRGVVNSKTDYEFSESDGNFKYSDTENARAKESDNYIDHEINLNKIHETKSTKGQNKLSKNEIRPILRSQNDIIEVYRNKLSKIHEKDQDAEVKHNFRSKSKLNHHNPDVRTSKETLRSNHMFSEAEKKKRIKDAVRLSGMSFNDSDDDLLSLDRRRFYQEKLNKLKRKLHHARKYNHNELPIIRPIKRASKVESGAHKVQIDEFYMPGRARFLHGF